MTKEQKDKILKALAEDINEYARECEKRIIAEQGKIMGANYMLQRFLDVLNTVYEPQEGLEQELSKDIEEIKEVINCDADAETKCKMISNILTAKPHYFKALEQELKTEKVIETREATPEEREIINKHIKSISKPTGVNFWDLYKEPCDDAISRQAVLEIAKSSKSNWIDNSVLFKRVNALPSVTPQQKTGHWMPLGNYDDFGNESSYKCSECGDLDTYPDNFCPNCGAKMQEVEK